MKKTLITSALLLCAVIAFAFFADLTGKWTGTLHAPDGNDYPLNYSFKVDGDKLTGAGDGQNGKTDITNGKIAGNDFSFNIDINGVDVKNTCKFYPEADSVGMDIDYQGFKMHATLTRAK